MEKLKYLFKRIINMDFKNMIKIAKKISKKTNKNVIFICLDIVICGFKYQAGYYDYQEFEFYLMNSKKRKTYLTRGINNQIIKKYNDKSSYYKFDDKIIFNKIFLKYLNRDYLDIRGIDNETLKKFLKGKRYIIVKPIDLDGGTLIEKIDLKNIDTNKLLKKLNNKKQYLIEDFIIQHEKMNTLYEKSVNTLRIYTFCHNNKTTFLQAILKIGNGSVVDNFSSGGMYTFVNESGQVIVPAIDKEDILYEKHPITKTTIVGFNVPMFEEAKKLVLEASKVVKEIGYVGWDVAISNKGPVIVEGNCFPGVFQLRASYTDEGILPKYKKVMDI